jgi:hypothetical protein
MTEAMPADGLQILMTGVVFGEHRAGTTVGCGSPTGGAGK